ncbi:MAG TPA: YciI family protein [Polyangiaceae bacterium]
MFVIELIYKAELSEIDANMRAHMAFLKQQYAAGRFLVSGRKVPRDGGVILAIGESREQIEGWIREDPFVARGLADYRIIEFRESQRAESIDALLSRGD